jgi:NitT/TauT family transport system permease protein
MVGRLGSQVGPAVLAVAVLAGTWEALGQVLQVSFFPPLSQVLVRLLELFTVDQIAEQLANSLGNLAIGYLIAAVVGTGVGALMGIYPKVEAALDIYVYTLLTTPTLIFAPIIFAIFGLGRTVVIVIIVLYSVLYILLNTAAAMRSAPYELIEMARSYGANDRQVFRRVLLPAAIPVMMSGFILATPRAIKGMVNGEMFIAVTGLGAIVIQAGKRFDATTVMAMLLLIVIISFIAVGLVRWLDRRLTRWLPSTARESATAR